MAFPYISFVVVALAQCIVSIPLNRDSPNAPMSYDRLIRVQRSPAVQSMMPSPCQTPPLSQTSGCLEQVQKLFKQPEPGVPCQAQSSLVFVFAASLNNCGRSFYMCVDDRAYLEQCPQGHFFNNDTQKCELLSPGVCPTTSPPETTEIASTQSPATTIKIEATTPILILPTSTLANETTAASTSSEIPTTTSKATTIASATTTFAVQPTEAKLEGTTTQYKTESTTNCTGSPTELPTTTEVKTEQPTTTKVHLALVIETTTETPTTKHIQETTTHLAETTTTVEQTTEKPTTPEAATPTKAELPVETTEEELCPEEETTVEQTTEASTTTVATTTPSTPSTVATTTPSTVATTSTMAATTTIAPHPTEAALEGSTTEAMTTKRHKCPLRRTKKPTTPAPETSTPEAPTMPIAETTIETMTKRPIYFPA